MNDECHIDHWLPARFQMSKLAPTRLELSELYALMRLWRQVVWMTKQKRTLRVLEFGCGVTTAAIVLGLGEPYEYFAMEEYQPCVDEVRKYFPHVHVGSCLGIFLDTQADKPLDVLFVDSSAGLGIKGLHRRRCLELTKCLVDGLVVVHDWNTRSGREIRKYIEGMGWYEFAKSSDKNGWAAFTVNGWHEHYFRNKDPLIRAAFEVKRQMEGDVSCHER